MGLFSRGKTAGPAELTTLWEHVSLLPDPLAYDDALLGQFVTRLDRKALKVFLREWQRALDWLGTRAHAAAVQPYPWVGVGSPFSVRRFQLARERVVLQGLAAFTAVMEQPGRLSDVSTGEPLTAAEVVARDDRARPEELARQIQEAARSAGIRVTAQGSSQLTEETVGLTERHDFHAMDPEWSDFDLVTSLEASDPTSEQVEDRIFPAVCARVAARLYDGCGRPLPRDLDVVYGGGLNLTFAVGDHWAPVGEIDPDWSWPEVHVRAVDLAPLDDETLTDALTAIAADAIGPMLVDGAALAPRLVALRDRYVDQVPAAGREALGPA